MAISSRTPAFRPPLPALHKRYPVLPARRVPKPTPGFGAAPLVALVLLLALPAVALVRLAEALDWRLSLGGLLLVSVATYLTYGSDKRRARDGGWRTPESTLHLLEFVGGWPAAFIAQRRLRHKTSKTSYQAVFWSIVAIHQLIAVDFLLGWRIGGALLGWGQSLVA